MNLKKSTKKVKNREGSYIVEASLTLPVFILAVAALLSIIIIISICENICFATALEMKEASLRAYSMNETVSLCQKIEKEVLKSCDRLSDFQIKKSRYFFWDSSMEVYDLICIEGEASFNVENSIGIDGQILFDGKLMTRGFTGAMQNSYGLSEAGFNGGRAQSVWIFPKYGEKYHGQNCIYIKNADDKDNVISIQKEDAERKGYTACTICGGT